MLGIFVDPSCLVHVYGRRPQALPFEERKSAVVERVRLATPYSGEAASDGRC
jgi:hypothetical protein